MKDTAQGAGKENQPDPLSRMRRYSGLALLYLAAVGAGWTFEQLGMPLPWMIGPLMLSAAVYISGLATAPVPVQTRPIGQMTVAAQVGLAFSPAALSALLSLAPLLVGTAIISAFCACIIAIGLSRVTGLRLPQAFLATFPISPVEASVMAEKHGCDPAPVVLAQTVRIASVVVLVPICIYAIDGWPDHSGAVRGGEFDLIGNGVLALLAIMGALLFLKLRLANPFFLGPLVLSAAFTAAGFQQTGVPPMFLAAAQVVLGTWLGSTFRRQLFIEDGRIVIALIASAILLLAVISACAVVLAAATGQNWEVLVLGAAPGGVTEMALTAKYLGVDLALVTAFQLTRILIFMPNIPWIIALIDCNEMRRGD